MMKIHPDLQYSSQHMWVKSLPNGEFEAGITDYAQDMLGDIVFVDAPQVDATVVAGTPCGLVESVKTGSDLHAPIDGVVTAINEELQGKPELINDKPYEAWIFRFKPALDGATQATLLSAEAYQALVTQ